MKTYYMGRFAIDLPADFKLEVQNHRFRLIAIKEYALLQNTDEKWRDHLEQIETARKPMGVDKNIISVRTFREIGEWAKGVLYYSDRMGKDSCNWDLFVAYGDSATIFSLKGRLDKEESMLAWLQVVAKAYTPILKQRTLRSGQFHTAQGVIELPYKRQESTYALFQGPMGVMLKVEMHEIHRAPEKEGIVDRTVAAVATGFAAGLTVKTIRSGKKTAAGLPGEEEILQGDDGKHKNVSFDWEYLGRVESGEQPMIQISADTKADSLDEKVSLWDQVLQSLRPVP